MHHWNRINVVSLQIPFTCSYIYNIHIYSSMVAWMDVCSFSWNAVASNLDQIANVTNNIQVELRTKWWRRNSEQSEMGERVVYLQKHFWLKFSIDRSVLMRIANTMSVRRCGICNTVKQHTHRKREIDDFIWVDFVQINNAIKSDWKSDTRVQHSFNITEYWKSGIDNVCVESFVCAHIGETKC